MLSVPFPPPHPSGSCCWRLSFWRTSSVPHRNDFVGWIPLCISKFLLAWGCTIEKLLVMTSYLMCITEKSLNSWDQWWKDTRFQICPFLFLYGNFLSFLCKKTCQVSFTQRPITCWVLNPRQKCWTKVSINISNWTVASASLCPLLACLPTCSHPCPTLPSKGDPLGFPPSSSSDPYITQPLLAVLVSWLRRSFLVGVPSFSFQISSPHMAQLRVMFTL